MKKNESITQDLLNSFSDLELDAEEKAAPKTIENEDKNLIELKNIHKTYLIGVEGVAALRGVSLKVKRGEFLIIFGKSGSGKTTLLNIIGTIDTPTKGSLSVCGTKISAKTKDKTLAHLRLKRIGFVFQSFNLLSLMTALENVEMPMILDGSIPSKERRSKAKKALKRVGLSERLYHTPSKLSGGEQQRVTISRAIANSPDLLLLDEPTGDLDTKNTKIVLHLLLNLNLKENVTLVMVTHDITLKDFADRVIWMRDGLKLSEEVINPERKNNVRKSLLDETNDWLQVNNLAFEEDSFKSSNFQNFQNTTFRNPNQYKHLKNSSSVKKRTQITKEQIMQELGKIAPNVSFKKFYSDQETN
ncbi:abc transporter h family member 2 [Anaeramoeba ignava]|uniref:Abc transporter h family member 2 n=1 Tax=Anaeramoeba ignava TaxID=1746090 RepID=A0A9Q0L786_ANAIG|nr:abc transporter h family member 2 [Anaeramoeba ignava]